MIIRCAWCGGILGEKPPYEDKSFTDGICDKCLGEHFPGQAAKIISILGEEEERAGISPPEEKKEGNPRRVRFDRVDIDSAVEAAKRLKSDGDLYVFATYLGYAIERRPPPGMQQYVVVHPDGSTETIKPKVGNPYVTITDPGKTTFKVGEVVSSEAFEKENERVNKLGEKPATGR